MNRPIIADASASPDSMSSVSPSSAPPPAPSVAPSVAQSTDGTNSLQANDKALHPSGVPNSVSPSSVASVVIPHPDVLAGALPDWDLVPQTQFVKRVKRREASSGA